MKIVRLTFIIGLIILLSCSTEKNLTQTEESEEVQKEGNNSLENNDNMALTNDSLLLVHSRATLVDDLRSVSARNKPTYIDTMFITNDSLHITVQYGGGCRKHEFRLVGSKSIMKSLPPKRSCLLVHEGEKDYCRAMIRQTLVFDISTLIEGHEQSGVYLVLNDLEILAGNGNSPQNH